MHNKLKECRLQNGYTCLEMAGKLNITKTFYWQIENGKRTLNYKRAYQIAKIFGVKPDDLFYNDYKNNKNCD